MNFLLIGDQTSLFKKKINKINECHASRNNLTLLRMYLFMYLCTQIYIKAAQTNPTFSIPRDGHSVSHQSRPTWSLRHGDFEIEILFSPSFIRLPNAVTSRESFLSSHPSALQYSNPSYSSFFLSLRICIPNQFFFPQPLSSRFPSRIAASWFPQIINLNRAVCLSKEE